MAQALTAPRKITYALFVLSLVVVAKFKLGPCLLAGLVSYMILDLTDRRARDRGARPLVARWAAVAVFVVLATALGWVFVKFARVAVIRLPMLLDQVLPQLTQLSDTYGLDLPVENAREAKDLLAAQIRENAGRIGKTSGLFTLALFQIVAGMFIAILRFLSPTDPEDRSDLFDALRHEFSSRVWSFMRSFERVLGAQFMISVLNTVLTSVFLYAAGFPFKNFLILTTFVCGLVPIVGNIISNVAIVTAGLTISIHLAFFGLAYLVIIHKLEYLLNSRIIGGSIETPMWATLIGLVVGEALLGVPGVLLAPALVHWIREELRLIPAPSRA